MVRKWVHFDRLHDAVYMLPRQHDESTALSHEGYVKDIAEAGQRFTAAVVALPPEIGALSSVDPDEMEAVPNGKHETC